MAHGTHTALTALWTDTPRRQFTTNKIKFISEEHLVICHLVGEHKGAQTRTTTLSGGMKSMMVLDY